MEELQPQDIEDLLQELGEEDGVQESPPPDVEELLRVLQAGSASARLEAANQLGKVSVSSPRIVDALIAAQESDSDSTVRWYVTDALQAPSHQLVLGQRPDLMKRVQALTAEAATAKRARQESEQRAQQRASQALIDSKARPFFFSWTRDQGFIVGLLVGAMLWIPATIWRKTSQSQRLGVAYGGLGFLIGSYTAVVIWGPVLDTTCFVVPAALAVALGPLVGLLSGWGIGTLVRRQRPEQAVLGRALGALLGAFVAGFILWGVIASVSPPPPGR